MSDDELIRECRQFLQCDGGCGQSNPPLRCSRCHLVHYCSRDCQVKDWKQEHKSMCVPIEVMKKKLHAFEGGGGNGTTQMEANETIRRQVLEGDPECAICLERPMIQPVVLEKCHHAFCFHCLRNWTKVQTQPRWVLGGPQHDTISSTTTTSPTCPLCRQEIPNVAESIIQDVLLLLAAAQKRNASASYIQEQCTNALAKMELLKEIMLTTPTTPTTIDSTLEDDMDVKFRERCHYQLLYFQLSIHLLLKEYDEALKVATESEQQLRSAVRNGIAIEAHLRLMEESNSTLLVDPDVDEEMMDQLETMYHQPYTSPMVHIDAVLQVARIQILQQDWTAVKATYKEIMLLYDDNGEEKERATPTSPGMTPQQQREIYTGMAQCAYELGNYEFAIDFGKAAIAMNRYFPGCHHYVALSYLATSHTQEAQQCAAEAVMYEAPWDQEHRAKTKEFYRTHFFSAKDNVQE
jgi:tetratricopeptide (TPR) repeat protein